MARISPAVASKRARIAGLTVGVKTGKRQPNDPELEAAYGDLAYAMLAEHAARVVSSWPAPTEAQLAHVAAILRSGSTPPGASPPAGSSGGSTAPSKNRKSVVADRIAELGGGGDHAA
jgi:hypothetical protein